MTLNLTLSILLSSLSFLGVMDDEKIVMNETVPEIFEDKILQINLDDNPMLHTIFEYVINKDSIHDKVYSVILNDYYGGTIVEIIELGSDTLDGAFYWDGYALVGDNMFVINTIDSNFHFNYVSPKQSKTFKMDRNYNPETFMKSFKSFFYILGDKYAQYHPEAGWIWSDGKPDE